MELAETTEGNLIILNLKGDIDLQHSPKLRDLLRAKVKSKCPALVVDFSQVNYIDSSGLATFVEYYQGARQFSGKVAMAAMSNRVKSVFDLVRLSEVFPIFPTLEEAKKSLGTA